MLVLHEVTKSFGRTQALAGLSLRVEPGEVLGLLGPNGAGKTTTISLAVGLMRPTSGRIELEGLGSPHERATRARIGVAPQSLAIYGELTAAENLILFGGLYGLGRKDRRRRAAEVLEQVGLADRADDRTAGFSGGMKRRLNLAAALVHRPRLLLLDEPTAGVDPQSRSALLDTIRDLRDDSITVVYTTHYMEEAERLCDRVAIVDRGRLLTLDTVEALIRRHADDTSRVHEIIEKPRAPQPRLARAVGATGDLESVFLELTGRNYRD
ncbi:MAG: ABC transporter ATP-binding protein [Planctomycetota bacterium]